MVTLIYTCGYPFSGKSTLARAISAETGFAVVEVDQWMDSTDTWRDAYIAAYREIRQYLGAGESVVFDSVAHTRKNRYRLDRLAAAYDARSICVWLDVPVDEANRRRLANQAKPVRANVSHEGFTWITSEFEPPEISRCFRFTADHPNDYWISTDLLPTLRGEPVTP